MPQEKGGTRSRKPTALKLLQGTLNTTRQNKAEPHGTPGIPQPPDYLCPEELLIWHRFAAILDPMRIVNREDFASFELLVATYGEMVRLRNALRRDGYAMTYETANDKTHTVMLRARPEMQLLADVDRRLVTLLARFGLTPADRSRVSSMVENGTANPEDEFAH